MKRIGDRFYRKKVSQSLQEAVNNALIGLLEVFYQERNMKIHLVFGIVAILLSLLLRLDLYSFLWIASAITLVFVAEVFNTVIESLVDMITMRDMIQAKIIKDMAAGAVLISAIYSVIVGYMIFYSKVKLFIVELLHLKIDLSSYRDIITMPEYMGILIAIVTTLLVVYLKVKMERTERWQPLKGGAVSGHTALAFALATYISLTTHSFKVLIASFFIALLVAHSRLEARIHTFPEVLLGALVGSSIAVLSYLVFR